MKKRQILSVFVLAMLAVIAPAFGQKKPSPASASLANGDHPPGNAMSLSVPKARSVLRQVLLKKYVGKAGEQNWVVGNWNAELSAPANIHVRADNFDLVAPYTWAGKSGDSDCRVSFKEAGNYVQAYQYKFGGVFYAVGFLPKPRDSPLCSYTGLFKFPLQLLWSDPTYAELFAHVFNRLAYAAHHDSSEQEFASFRAAAAAWRENPSKPPLSPEADRERLLAENAFREHDLDASVEHYESALEIQPMWPAGWFNLALIYGEQDDNASAANRMKHYLELVPDAPDAKSAHDQMLIWEDKAKQ